MEGGGEGRGGVEGTRGGVEGGGGKSLWTKVSFSLSDYIEIVVEIYS